MGYLIRPIPYSDGVKVTRLKRKVARIGARFIFISAVVPEVTAKEFAQWLTGSEEGVLSVKWRPTRQLFGRFYWYGNFGTIDYPDLKYEEGRPAWIPKIIEKHTASLPKKSFTAAKLALAFAKQGSVLVFCGTTPSVNSVAKELIKEIEKQKQQTASMLPSYEDDDLLSIEIAKEWLGEDHELIGYLRNGIGIHYGPMPEALRRAIEDEFKSNKLKIIVATNTLGQGVNLPIKTVIVHSLNIFDFEDNRSKPLKVRDFWNICGRAGRALQDTEGQIIFIAHRGRDYQLFEKYSDVKNIESVKGRLYEILKTLLQRRLTDADILEKFSENLIDTHLLSMLIEESIDTPDEEFLADFLNDSLVKVQAINSNLDLEPLINASTMVSRNIYASIQDAELRNIYVKTGFSIKSCEKLKESIEEKIDSFVDFCNSPENEFDVLKLILDVLINLHEMKERKIISYREGVEDYDLLRNWINFKSIPELAGEFTNEEDVEKVAEYIDEKFVYKFSWGINAFIKILAYKMNKDLEDLPLFMRYLSSMAKFGVNTPYACWAMSLGILSRNVANKVAAAFIEEHGEGEDFNDFVEWFKTLDREKFGELGVSGYQMGVLEKKVAKLNVCDFSEYTNVYTSIKEKGILTDIKGLTYEGRFENYEGVEEGSILNFQRDYLNEYDINAIKIYYTDKELGFISSKLARISAPFIDFGESFRVILKNKEKKNIKIM